MNPPDSAPGFGSGGPVHVIIGGTGALGSATARRLLDAGERVRIMTRSPERATALAGAGAEVVQGNLLDRASLERACEGVAGVLAAAHAIFGRGRESSEQVDGKGHRALIDVARQAGVRRFVYTSVHDFGSAYDRVPFFRIKRETEAYLKASGLAYTILRPTAFIESHAHELIGQPIMTTGKAILFGRGEQPRNFVAADDVAQVAVLALREGRFAGAVIAIGGPGHHTNMDVVRLYEAKSGRSAKVARVPLALLRVGAVATRPFHPGLSQVLRISVLTETVGQGFEPPAGQEPLPVTFRSLGDWVTAKVAAEVAAGPPA